MHQLVGSAGVDRYGTLVTGQATRRDRERDATVAPACSGQYGGRVLGSQGTLHSQVYPAHTPTGSR